MVAGVTTDLTESNGTLPPGFRRVYDSRHLQADCQELGSAPDPTLCKRVWATVTFFYEALRLAVLAVRRVRQNQYASVS